MIEASAPQRREVLRRFFFSKIEREPHKSTKGIADHARVFGTLS